MIPEIALNQIADELGLNRNKVARFVAKQSYADYVFSALETNRRGKQISVAYVFANKVAELKIRLAFAFNIETEIIKLLVLADKGNRFEALQQAFSALQTSIL